MNRNFEQAEFLAPHDAFKKQSVFVFTLHGSEIDTPRSNYHTFSCPFFLNVVGARICSVGNSALCFCSQLRFKS